jgi:hypothetical protein
LIDIQTFTRSLPYCDWFANTINYTYGILSNNDLFCLADGSVYFMQYQEDKPAKIEKISGNLSIKQFVPSEDNSFCYVITEEGDLYQLDLNGNQKWCLDQVFEIIRNYWQGEEEFYFGRKSSHTIVSSSGSYYQLFYRKDDNTITEVEGADCVTVLGSLFRTIYQDATYESDHSYYMPNRGKGIKVNFPSDTEK